MRVLTAGLTLTMLFATYNPEAAAQSALLTTRDGASGYVPLESWIYPAMDRLIAAGYVRTAVVDLRPWTRRECARLVKEASQNAGDATPDALASSLALLEEELMPELREDSDTAKPALRLVSAYQATTEITGRPLTDGFHFAQTLTDEEGRAFGQGLNSFTGLRLSGTAGVFAAEGRLELQRVAGVASPNAAAQQAIALADFTPAAAEGPAAGYLRGRLLEGAVSFGLRGNQLTFGRQPLWWGPARSGSTLFSDNVEPLTMLRYDRTEPFRLPGFLHALGDVRLQLLVGRLSGTQFVHTRGITFGSPGRALGDQPFLHGEKLSFRPTSNLEVGVSRTVLFAGEGAPFTTASFLRSVFSLGTGDESHDPGDRRTAVDASYRLPRLRRFATAYFDGFAEDQPLPLNYPTESTWISGVAVRQLPFAPQLELRAEGLLSPHRDLSFPGFFYFNVHFLSGYTNDRQLLGSWIGREGQGEQLWATWRFHTRSFVALTARHQVVASEFLRGGSLSDLRATAEFWPAREWQVHVEAQGERWRFPLLSDRPRRDAAITFVLSFVPLGGRSL